MFGDSTNLPIGGGIILSALLYGAISVFVTGPLVAERTIERGDWQAQCRANLKDALVTDERASDPLPNVLPNLDCNSLLGMFGTEGRQICRRYGNPGFKLPGMDQLEARQKQMREIRRRRLEAAIGNLASRCHCAASLIMENRRIPFAIYAGSARLIAPAPVKNLAHELEASLRSPLCAAQE